MSMDGEHRITTGDGRRASFDVTSETLFMFLRHDDVLFHLFRYRHEDARAIIVQAFAPDGEYLGASEVDVLSKEYGGEEAVHEVIGATADGVFFVVRYEDGFFPRIRAFGVEVGVNPSR